MISKGIEHKDKHFKSILELYNPREWDRWSGTGTHHFFLQDIPMKMVLYLCHAHQLAMTPGSLGDIRWSQGELGIASASFSLLSFHHQLQRLHWTWNASQKCSHRYDSYTEHCPTSGTSWLVDHLCISWRIVLQPCGYDGSSISNICWILFLYVGDLLVIFCSGSHDAMTSTLTLRWNSSLPVPTLVVARGCWCCVCQTQPGQQQQHRLDECLQHLRTSVGCWEDLNSGYFRQSVWGSQGRKKVLVNSLARRSVKKLSRLYLLMYLYELLLPLLLLLLLLLVVVLLVVVLAAFLPAGLGWDWTSEKPWAFSNFISNMWL